MHWEARSTATASNVNGGGYNTSASGTDYSQQNSAEHAFTDMVIDGAVNTRFTSAVRPGTAADIGNIINVVSGTGFTVQHVEITSLTGTAYNVDKSLGTLGSTGGTGRLGGAKSTVQGALTAMVASNTIWVYSTHTTASTISGGTSGVGNLPSRIIGYSTTRAAALAATLSDAEYGTITSTSSAATTVLSITGSHWIVQNLKIDGAALSQRCLFMATSGQVAFVNHVWVTRCTQRGIHSNNSNNIVVADCLATDCDGGVDTLSQGSACFVLNGFADVVRCVAKDSTNNGFCADNCAITLTGCVAYNLDLDSAAGANGFYIFGSTGARIYNCTFADLAGSGVLNPNASAAAMGDFLIENNVFSNITRYGLESSTASFSDTRLNGKVRKNAYFSCTLGQRSLFPTGTDEITLTASPFTDLATADLDLNSTSGGGASLRGAGIPGELPGLSLVSGAMDVGALQSSGGGTDGSSMIDLWREWTGEFSTTRVPDAAVNKYLQSGLVRFNQLVGYSFTDDTLTLVAGTQEYDQPTGTVEIVFVEHNGRRLEKADLEEWERKEREWRNLPASTPTHWAHYGSKVVLIPEPDTAAVAAAGTATVRFLRVPRDVATYGPEGLNEAGWRAAVKYGVAEWCGAHPDSATAQMRRQSFREEFAEDAAGEMEFYTRRRLARGAPSELLTASGLKRAKG